MHLVKRWARVRLRHFSQQKLFTVQTIDPGTIHALFNRSSDGQKLLRMPYLSADEAIDNYLSLYIQKNRNEVINALGNDENTVITYERVVKYVHGSKSDNLGHVTTLERTRRKIMNILFDINDTEISSWLESKLDRERVKKLRASLPKISIFSFENRVNYAKFLAILYETSSDKQLSINKSTSPSHLLRLLEAYRALPEPQPDYIESQHLENLLSIFLKQSRKTFRNIPKLKRDYVVSSFARVIHDLFRFNIPLTRKERNHLFNLRMLLYSKDEIGPKYSDASPIEEVIRARSQDREPADDLKEKIDLISRYELFANKKDRKADPYTISIFVRHALALGLQQLATKIFMDALTYEPSQHLGKVWNRVLISQLIVHYFRENPDPQISKFNLLIKSLGQFHITLDISLVNVILSKILFDLNDLETAKIVFSHLVDMSVSIEAKDSNPHKLMILDHLRASIDLQLGYNPSLLFPFSLNQDTTLLFFRFSTDGGLDFSDVFKLLIIHLEGPARKQAMQKYNLSNPDNQVRYSDIHLSFTESSRILPENLKLRTIAFLHMLQGFDHHNKEETDCYESWNFANLQLVTSLYLQTLASNPKSLNSNIYKAFIRSYISVLSTGNVRVASKIPEDIPKLDKESLTKLIHLYSHREHTGSPANYKVVQGEGWPYDVFNSLSSTKKLEESPVEILYSTDKENLFDRYNKSLQDDGPKEKKIADLVNFLQIELNNTDYEEAIPSKLRFKHFLTVLSEITI